MRTIVKDANGNEYTVSRWLKVRTSYDISKRNPLYDFISEGAVDYFIYNKQKYAIDRFILRGCAWNPVEPLATFHNGKYYGTIYAEDWHGDLYGFLGIESTVGGEYVRVYERIRRW